MNGLSKAYVMAMEKIESEIEEAIKADGQKKVCVHYAAFDFDEWDIPINNLKEIPLKGNVKLYAYAENGSGLYESDVMENPTWLDICVATNRMISETKTGDQYLEGLKVYKKDDLYYAELEMR